MRSEAISFIYQVFSQCEEEKNMFIKDEVVKCIKKFSIVTQELMVIKSFVKGAKVESVLTLLSVLINADDEILRDTLEKNNLKEYLKYAFSKDPSMKKMFKSLNQMSLH